MQAIDGRPRHVAAWRRFRWLLMGLVFCRGVVLMCVMPPFEAWDEYQHVAYVAHIARTGQAPVPGQALVPADLLTKLGEFPQPRCTSDPRCILGTEGYARYWAEGATHPRRPVGPMELYEAQHGSFYYRLVAPMFQAAGGLRNLTWSVGLLRLLNLVLTVMAVGIAVEGSRRLACDNRVAGLLGLIIAMQPLFLENGVRVANDSLGVLLATMAVVLALGLRERRMVYQCGFLGLVIGLAIRAKAVHYGLLPFAGYCWCAAMVRERVGMRRAGLALGLLVLGMLVVTQDEIIGNLAHFGSLTPTAEALHNRRAGRGIFDLLRTATEVDWRECMAWIWIRGPLGVGGWSFLHPSLKQLQLYQFTVVVSLLSGVWQFWPEARRGAPVFRSRQGPAACAAVCASYSVALAYHLVQSQLAWGITSTGAWYAAAALPWFLVLVGGYGMSLPVGRLRFLLPLLLVFQSVKSDAVIVAGLMFSTYSGGAQGWQALSRLASLQPALFGTPTLLLAATGALVFLALSLSTWARWTMVEPGEPPEIAGIVPGPMWARFRGRPGSVELRPR